MQPIRRGGVALAACTAAILWLTSGTAWASSTDGGGTVANKLTHGEIGLNLLWIVIGAVLVIFMQAGFALVETGLIRAKNASHTFSMNFLVYGLGMFGFFICGFALMCGGYNGTAIGGPGQLGGLPTMNQMFTVDPPSVSFMPSLPTMSRLGAMVLKRFGTFSTRSQSGADITTRAP